MQVYIQEDEEQNIHFKHLSVHRAASEEEALNLVSSTAAVPQQYCSSTTARPELSRTVMSSTAGPWART
jgi:hypothetical protein